MIETRVDTRLVCPAELVADLGPPVEPGPEAIVRHNTEGGAWLEAKIARGERAEKLLVDAGAACRAAEILDRSAKP